MSHKFEVLLVKEVSYWKGRIVNFSGPNASYFYDLLSSRFSFPIPFWNSRIRSQSPSNLEIHFESKIQSLQNQIHSLQERIRTLEEKNARRGQKEELGASQTTPQDALLLSNQKKDQNEPDFITLGRISQEEKLAIMKAGFQRNQEGKVSLKDYYEGKGEDTLLEWKGYRIKYDSLRKTKFYKNLKLSYGFDSSLEG